MRSKSETDNTGTILAQSDNEDNSDYEENEEEEESDGPEIGDDMDDASHDTGNAGWADVMQKILKTSKPKRKKTLVLAKAKKLCDVKVKEKKEEPSFEIDGIKEEIKTELKEAVNETNIAATKSRIRRKECGIRVKPSITDREHERMLQKIATKGVVQLFNAVRQQQTEIKKKLSEAGPLERKREQVYKSIDKNTFLDVLMGGSKSIPVNNAVKSEKPIEQTDNKGKDHKMWNVLRDDFIMGAKLKDWDKKNVEEEDSSAPEDMDSDMD
ncbi:RRP15-like protein [Monomorium pharaonis]|uniref:RRP15-like protein n=1 Tax=Monomorium pharaonis TaxID=307658 RepID=UPI00063F9FC0|nr:RRP15-like protein [Monomorium pharaonis]XP_012538434.1 RRP15-like protein [Monomorium pharaonis]